MWLPPALLLLSLPGCFVIQGPGTVTAVEQGSMTVQCHYRPGWESYSKWWCRGRIWSFCQVLVQTSGTEQEERSGRVSIRDNHRDRSITVTMEGLRQDDADTYWCGIKRVGTDRGTQVKVTIDPVGSTNLPAMPSTKPPARPTATGNMGPASGSYNRGHYLLLVFVKVPVLLVLASVVLWLKGPRRVSEELRTLAALGNTRSPLPTDHAGP